MTSGDPKALDAQNPLCPEVVTRAVEMSRWGLEALLVTAVRRYNV